MGISRSFLARGTQFRAAASGRFERVSSLFWLSQWQQMVPGICSRTLFSTFLTCLTTQPSSASAAGVSFVWRWCRRWHATQSEGWQETTEVDAQQLTAHVTDVPRRGIGLFYCLLAAHGL
eukprot:4223531-Amphidinium_carterae.1